MSAPETAARPSHVVAPFPVAPGDYTIDSTTSNTIYASKFRMTPMKDSASSRTPKTVGNYHPQHRLESLEKFDIELRDTWP